MPIDYDKVYNALYNRVRDRYVGKSGGFSDENDMRSWIGGIGHGFEEALGRGAIGDTRKDVRTLAVLARLRAGQTNTRSLGRVLDPNKQFNLGLPDILPGLTSPFSGYENSQKLGEFAPKPDEDYKTWGERTGLSSALSDEELKKLFEGQTEDPGAAEQAAKQASYEQWRDDVMHQLDDFAKKMNMSVPELLNSSDMGAMRTQSQAVIGANAGAYGAGLGSGGISALNSERAQQDALLGYQMQRAQLGQQAYGNLMAGLQNTTMSNEDRRRYEQSMNMQLQEANNAAYQQQYQQGQSRMSGLFGLAGGVIGGMYGGPAGASAGSQIGQGVGGYFYGSNHPYQTPGYRYPSGSSRPGSGTVGRGLYGGSQ